jgi:hypothetical protein
MFFPQFLTALQPEFVTALGVDRIIDQIGKTSGRGEISRKFIIQTSGGSHRQQVRTVPCLSPRFLFDKRATVQYMLQP